MAMYDYYNTNDDGFSGNCSGTQWYAQSFTVVAAFSITSVKLLLYKNGSTINTVTVSIQAMSGGDPDGTDLAIGTTDGNTLTTDTAGEWREITFTSAASLVVGTQYAIVVRCLAPAGTDDLCWRKDATSPAYTGGNHETSTDSGGTWTADTGMDFMFECWGDLLVPTADSNVSYGKCLVAVGLHSVYHDKASAGTMVELTAATNDIDTETMMCNIAEAYGKVFIANETNLKVADFVNIMITTDDLIVAPGTHAPSFQSVLSGDSSGASMVVDYITDRGDGVAGVKIYGKRITTVTFTSADTVSGEDADGNTVSFDLTANEVSTVPFWHNWTTFGNADGADETFGALPTKATLICLWRGRVVLSGDLDQPNQWYMSREGNPFDFLYADTDAQAAVAGQNAEAGLIGDIVTALCPVNRDYLVFGCANMVYLLTGNPMEGGSLDPLADYTGMYGAQSWCVDGEGNLWFWGTGGLYKATIPGKPVCISEQSLPKIVEDEAANPTTHKIVLHYDPQRKGIQVCITQLSDGTNSNYWYDLQTEGFFPENYPEECAVHSAFFYDAVDPNYRVSIYGCKDGYLRYFLDSAADDDIGDDDEKIDSYVTWGPLLIADDPKFEGKITGLDCVTAGGATGGSQSDSDDIECKIFTAKSAEEIAEKLSANSAPVLTKTIIAPGRRRGSTIKRRLRGIYTGIRLGNSTLTEKWGFEQLMVEAKRAGRFK